MLARTIEDVIKDIDEVVRRSIAESSRIGYFAALYHHVATSFKQAIARGEFKDPDRIERLDVVFFDRYLAAVDEHWKDKTPSGPWRATFNAAEDDRLIVLQHLLLGMNAHINFDLGIAVAEVCPGPLLPEFQPDYMKMNALLAALLGGVLSDLCQIWPTLRILDWLGGSLETGLINFSMHDARDQAWKFATELDGKTEPERQALIARYDRDVTDLAKDVWHPGLFSIITGIVRLGERGTVPEIIHILLEQTGPGSHKATV